MTAAAARLAAVAFLLVAVSQVSRAQPSSTIVAPAVVKIAVLNNNAGTTATGVLIDPAGYILTSFRAVGDADGRATGVGGLYAADNRYLIATQEGADARFRYVARVVRGDIRRDLAILQITARLGGGSLRGIAFPVLGEGSVPAQGAPARILGYPAGATRLRATSTSVRRVVRDSYRQPASVETAHRVDRGMIGGPLVDPSLRLSGVVVSTSGLVRPSARLPRDWRLGVQRRDLRDLRIEGMRRVTFGEPLRDATYVAREVDNAWLFYELPPERPVRLRVEPPLDVRVLVGSHTVRRGRGAIDLDAQVPASAVLAVAHPAAPTAFRVHAEGAPTSPQAAPARRTSSSDAWLPGGGSAFVPRFGGETVARSGLTGQMIDARTGQAISGGTVIVSRRGVDLGALLGRFLSGGIGERAFRRQLLGTASTGPGGRFQLRDLPPGERCSLAAFAPGYRPVVLDVTAPRRGETRPLPTLRMTL